jgi:hypothetical protein
MTIRFSFHDIDIEKNGVAAFAEDDYPQGVSCLYSGLIAQSFPENEKGREGLLGQAKFILI